MTSEILYAESDNVSIAYQVSGQGEHDLVLIPGWISNLEVAMELSEYVQFLEYLEGFCRVIRFDKRGTGLSDRVSELPSLEVRMDDVRAVLDAVGSNSASLFGWSEGGAMAILFAATYPERINKLILAGTFPRRSWAPDYPYGVTDDVAAKQLQAIQDGWGKAGGIASRFGSMSNDPRFRQWWGRYQRMSATPHDAVRLLQMNREIDVRPILPAIRRPTLVLHARSDEIVSLEAGRQMAQSIPEARFVEYDGDHTPFCAGADVVLRSIEEFVTGEAPSTSVDRVLATVLFTDIVGATAKATAMGDRAWRDLINTHHQIVRRILQTHRGTEIDTAGDGFFASFDGPARAIRCAQQLERDLRQIGLPIRVGIHTGECEKIGAKLGGIAVHIGARVAALADAGQVLVSSTVRDLVAGSGLTFTDFGRHQLKGVDEDWQLFVAG